MNLRNAAGMPPPDFESAASWRPKQKNTADPTYHPADITGLLQHLRTCHPIRVARIIRDLRWLHKKGLKFGIKILR